MKKIMFLPILTLLSIMNSCSSNDSNNDNSTTLTGTWSLKTGSGSITGRTDNFPAGEIRWMFDTANHTVEVVNTNTDPDKIDGLDTGTYHYIIDDNEETGCSRRFFISETNMGCYTINNNTITIDQSVVDGITLELKKELLQTNMP